MWWSGAPQRRGTRGARQGTEAHYALLGEGGLRLALKLSSHVSFNNTKNDHTFQ
jgi:hypothetical protein